MSRGVNRTAASLARSEGKELGDGAMRCRVVATRPSITTVLMVAGATEMATGHRTDRESVSQ
jgi:hypothetical protein